MIYRKKYKRKEHHRGPARDARASVVSKFTLPQHRRGILPKMPVFKIILIATLLIALVAVTSASLPALEFCVQDEWCMRNLDPTIRAAGLQRMQQLGATHLRMMLYIQDFDPCCGSKADQRMAIYEAAVQEAQAAGFSVQMVITGVAASWGAPTQNGSACGPPSGINPSLPAYENFVKEMVQHFSALGVHRYSLWNEPNLSAFLCATNVTKNDTSCSGSTVEQTATLYGALYRSGYSIIRQLESSNSIPPTQILMGELAPINGTSTFIEELFRTGQQFEADGFSVHPYQYCTPPDTHSEIYVNGTLCNWPSGFGYGIAWTPTWQWRMGDLHNKGRLSTPDNSTVPLYLTEFGYHRDNDSKAALPEDVRALWYPLAMSVAMNASALSMNIYQIFAGDGAPGVWDTGIVAPGNVPLASFDALQQWALQHGYPVRNVSSTFVQQAKAKQLV